MFDTLVALRLNWARPGEFMRFWNHLKKAENAVAWYMSHTVTDEKISEIWSSRDGCEVTCELSMDKVVFSMDSPRVKVEIEVDLRPSSAGPKCTITTTKHGAPAGKAVTRENAVIEDGKLLVTGLAS